MYKKNNNLINLALLGSLFSTPLHAFEAFKVKDIRLEGLQRIDVGTIFNYLPVKVGDEFDRKVSKQAIQSLYKTGFFKDVRIEREGDVLVVFVAERPAIADIKIEGNESIDENQLNEVLKQIGLTKGKVFDRSVLDNIEQELQRQYYGLGKYAVKIESKTTPLERNRVQVEINVAEGDSAEIHTINIVGNSRFDNEKLLDRLQLAEVGFFGGREQYSRQQLSGDLERLKSYYQDRGYINFRITSTQVSLTPDKQDVYITVNIEEGKQYKVSEVKLAGDYILNQDEIFKLITLTSGDIFSAKKMSDSRTRITDRLAEEGYAFANVNVIPQLNDKDNTVALTVFVDPSRRVYVRRINISGNNRTSDEVIRREMRQMEGDWLNSKNVALSRQRLERLGFFEEVSVETPAVAGSNDQVDVNFSVAERATGNLMAGIGYSDVNGVIYNLGLTQDNIFGTGNRFALNLEQSDVVTNYNFNFTDPYFTLDGVSLNYGAYFKEVDASEADLSSYSTNNMGLTGGFSIPLTEYSRLYINGTLDSKELNINTAGVAQTILDFIDEKGNEYSTFKLGMKWVRDSRNRRIFADRGSMTSIGTEVTTGDLEFYKLDLRHTHYFPITEKTTLLLNGVLGYGDGFGETSRLPPFENYYVGGQRSVRGYQSNSLGPRDIGTATDTGRPIGGDTKIAANAEVILPNIFNQDSKSIRFALFLDGGYVYNYEDGIDFNEMRYSSGAAMLWLTPVGALRFSYAKALNPQEQDETDSFQFTLGSPF